MLYQLSYASGWVGFSEEKVVEFCHTHKTTADCIRPTLQRYHRLPALDGLAPIGLADEIHICAHRNNPTLEAHVEELSNGLSTVVAIVQGAFIDVHSDEAIG
jgi:hypothetical protein